MKTKGAQMFNLFYHKVVGGARAFFFCFVCFIPRHTIVPGHYGFTFDVRVSVGLSVRPSVRPYVRLSIPTSSF